MSRNISGNISTEINNFPEIFPREIFGKVFKNLYEIWENRLSPLEIGIANLNSELKMLKLCY